MDEYYLVYARSWKRPEPYPDFHRRLAEKLSARDELLLGMVYFEDQPVAAQMWVIHQRTASIVKLSYDETFKEYSFGTILTHKLISHVLSERTIDTIDYLTGDDRYKRDWMSSRRARLGIVAFNRTLLGRLLALNEVYFKPALKRVMRTTHTTIPNHPR
jgi:CelD/BcsL family acetyltransferase involved in cellulose biosynthesis